MRCKNCNNSLIEDHDFCSNCGARVIRNRLTIKNLFEHISETFFNYDNKLFRTFIKLFTDPADVIGGYISGVRKKYVNPLSYLGLALTIGGLYIFIMNKFFPDSLDMSAMVADGQEEFMKNWFEITQDYYTIMMVLFLPFYALISRLVFLKRKDYNYTEHIIFFAYVFAQTTFITSILNIVGGFIHIQGEYLAYFSIAFQIIYIAYCLKCLYKMSLKGIILRTLLFFLILLIILIFLMLIGVIFAIIFKDSEAMKSMIEAQKTAQEAKGG